MKRYKNVDKLRGAACLLVLLFHVYSITGSLLLNIPIIKAIQIKGGDIGVTIFFVLSGYGIYYSLDKMSKNGEISFLKFIKKRLKRIGPQYYLNIIVLLLLSSSVVYLSKEHFFNILLHVVFLHSISFASHGAINGSLWTMSVIFQFYIVAIPLYRFIKKIDNIVISLIIFVSFTVLSKYIVLNYLWIEDVNKYGSFAISIPSRQLYTSLDNFGIGMLVADYSIKKKESNLKVSNIFFIFLSVIGIIILANLGCSYLVYDRNVFGYLFFSILAFLIGLLILGISFDIKSCSISKVLEFVAKHEYAIYLWHLPIIKNMVDGAGIVNMGFFSHGIMLYIIMVGCSIGYGVLMDHFIR